MGKMKLLVIDDEQVILDFFKALDEKMNVDILCAVSGVKGLEEVKSKAIDIVFIDTHMPKMNGYETFCALKEHNPNLHAFMMADSASDLLVEKCLQGGSKGVIFKPPELDKVAGTLMQIEAINFFKTQLENACKKAHAQPESTEYEKIAEKVSSLVKKAEERDGKQKKSA